MNREIWSNNRKCGGMCLLLFLIGIWTVASGETLGPILLSEAAMAGRGGGPAGFESEHQPTAVRRYRIISGNSVGRLEAFVRHPDGSVTDADISREGGKVTVSFKTPLGDGPMHGIHTLYLTDRQVVDGCLVVRTAKWHTIHHNCGWGHAYKNDETRTRVRAVETVPLDISCGSFWNGNFHNDVRSGDMLSFEISSFGNPLSGADIRLISGRGWGKNSSSGIDGAVNFQLIRDYYPEAWREFDKRHKERFIAVAEYAANEAGTLSGKAYDRVHYITSLPWTYAPAREEYASVAYGLFLGVLTMAVSGVGVFIYRQRRARPYREATFHE